MLEKERVGTWVPLRDGKTEVCVRGGLQCDDMGLGKTIQTMAVMANHVVPSTLMLAPLAMIDTWTQIALSSGFEVFEASTGQGGAEWIRMNPVDESVPLCFLRRRVCRPALYITNFEKVLHSPSLFSRLWDRVVLDEAHKIRNPEGQIAAFIHRIKGTLRWALTGTPLVNGFRDVVSLLAFLGVPYVKGWCWEGDRHERIVAHLMIHRSLDSLRRVIKGAPPVPEIVDMVLPFSSPAEEDFYHGVQGATKSMVTRYASDQIPARQKFKMLLRLRQISVHPQIYIDAKRREDGFYRRDDWKGPSTKLEAVAKLIREDEDGEDHKYIIFCQFADEMKLLGAYLMEEGLVDQEHLLSYDGSMNQRQRADVLKRSKELVGRTVLLLQLQAGGVGLNLQEYDRIIFVSPWWTASMRDQAIARAVRMGQKKTVKVWHLRLAAETMNAINIDRMIHEKAEEKKAMLDHLFAVCEKKKFEEISVEEDE